eukprot:1193005-Prorocentrum_minimum.AAC.3
MKRAHGDSFSQDSDSSLKIPRRQLRTIIGARGAIVRAIEEKTGAQVITPRSGDGETGEE